MTRKRIKAERRIRRKGWVVSNLMQPIVGNRGGESKQEMVSGTSHACRRATQGVIRKAGEIVLVKQF